MKVLAIDLGDVRTGVAISDMTRSLAGPLCVINQRDRSLLANEIARIVQREGVSEIVVGLAKNMDGSEGSSAQKCREFGNVISELTGLKAIMLDERGTTITAHNYLNMTDTRGKKRKQAIDSVAAVIILQNHLDSLG